MAYFLDLFSPETYEAFSKSNRDISGFRPRQVNMANKIKPGDQLICYMTRLSRWIGVLEVQSESFTDTKPIFYPINDPFVIRFKVNHCLGCQKRNVFRFGKTKFGISFHSQKVLIGILHSGLVNSATV